MKWLPKPKLPRLDFDYQPHRARLRPAGWILWVAALAFAGDVAWSYSETREALSARAREVALAQPPAPVAARQRTYQPRNAEIEVNFARATIHKIALPWGDLFRELGASAVEGVSVMSIQPDPEGGALQIHAQAEAIPAMLSYVARLESNGFFPSVTLLRHEVKRDEARQPIFFAILATWSNRR